MPPVLFSLVGTVSGHHKIHFVEQAQDTGTKQSMKANKAVRPGCFVVPTSSAYSESRFFANEYTMSNLLFLDIYACYPRLFTNEDK
jgi:hypothetical protein